eukprot:scaffold248278_cov63-Cyclotella_meneghiniana.AAC.1
MVVSVTNPAVKDICKRKGKESWLACYHRLNLFRSELAFNRIIGSVISYVKGDPRHIQGKHLKSYKAPMTSLAMCQEVMTMGIHTVQFCITKTTGCYNFASVEVGVIRPIEDLETKKTTYEGGIHHAKYYRRNAKAGDVIEIQLDLNEGCMKVIDEPDDFQSGLAGPYCWYAILQSSNSYTAALRVKRIT